MQEHFAHVAVLAPSYVLDGTTAATSCSSRHRPLDSRRCASGRVRDGVELVEGAALDRFVDGMPVITDDHAPVDQWLSQDRY